VPLLVLAGLSLPLLALAVYVGRPGHIEDQLGRGPLTSSSDDPGSRPREKGHA
jgi:hypothetical protein